MSRVAVTRLLFRSSYVVPPSQTWDVSYRREENRHFFVNIVIARHGASRQARRGDVRPAEA